MATFDLDSTTAQDSIHLYVADLVSETQVAIQEDSGQAVFLVKNSPLINTAIDLAKESVLYHGIAPQHISNEKKFAHVCFWMLKLTPISYVSDLPRTKGWIGGRVAKTDTPLEVPAKFSHVPVNTEITFKLYVLLYCYNQFPDNAAEMIEQVYSSKYSNEIKRSLRFHNYSARSMAMFLETLMMEKLA